MSDFPLLLCPDTQPSATDCRALLLLADFMTYYRALADDPIPAELQPLAAIGLCQGRTPVALGDHLPRFRQLLQELGRAGTEFYGGILARAGQPLPDEAAVWSLVTNLRQQGRRNTETEQELETIWNALLLLKLAEQYQAGEREIAAELAAVEHRQATLFEELKGDAEFAAQLAAIQAEEQTTAGVNQERLTRAWGQLFLRDNQEFPLLAVPHPGSALLLLDLAAALSDARPIALGTLPVPEPPEADFADTRRHWQASEADLLAKLHGLLFTFAREGVAEPAAWAAVSQQWEQAVQRHFVGQPQRLLTITALPSVPLASLLARLARGNKKGHGAFPHGLLACWAVPA